MFENMFDMNMFDCLKEMFVKKNIPKPENIISDKNIFSICVLTKNHIIYGNHIGEIIWYNIEKKEELSKKKAHERGIAYLETINSKKFISLSFDNIVKIWKTNYEDNFSIELKGIYNKHSAQVTKALLYNEKLMITSSLDKTIRIWNTKKLNKEDLLVIDKNSFGVESFIKVSDEDLIISSDEHGMLIFWKFSLEEKNFSLEKIELDCRVTNANSMCEIPNKKLVVADYKKMKIIDIKTKQIESMFVLNETINVIISFADIIVVGLKNGKIQLTDKNFGIYSQIESKNQNLIEELNIKKKENHEILFQNSSIINIKITDEFFIVVTNEEINFFEREKYNKIKHRFKLD